MSIQLKYESAEEKLERLCEKNDLCLEFLRHAYPVVFRFTYDQSVAYQIKINETDTPPPVDPNAAIEMIFGDDVLVRITSGFEIDDELLNALKTGAKKLYLLFLQVW